VDHFHSGTLIPILHAAEFSFKYPVKDFDNTRMGLKSGSLSGVWIGFHGDFIKLLCWHYEMQQDVVSRITHPHAAGGISRDPCR
jgi:hypothetical protein